MDDNNNVGRVMTVNQFIKKMREAFPNLEYRAKDKDGRVFKSVGWKDYENEKNVARYRKG